MGEGGEGRGGGPGRWLCLREAEAGTGRRWPTTGGWRGARLLCSSQPRSSFADSSDPNPPYPLPPSPQGHRVGLIRLADLTGTALPLKQPLALLLTGDGGGSGLLTTSSAARYSGGGGGSSSMGAGTYHPSYQQQQPWGTGTGAPLLVRHDFRASPACVVGLRLAVRNCASEAAEGVVVEVSPGWDVGVSPPLLSPGGGGGVEVNPARLFHPSLDMGIRAAPCRPMSDPACSLW